MNHYDVIVMGLRPATVAGAGLVAIEGGIRQ